MAYIIKLDSEKRVRVFETQIVEARLANLRDRPTYNNLVGHYESIFRDALNISRYILMREDNSEVEKLDKILRIDNALKRFAKEALDIINNRVIR